MSGLGDEGAWEQGFMEVRNGRLILRNTPPVLDAAEEVVQKLPSPVSRVAARWVATRRSTPTTRPSNWSDSHPATRGATISGSAEARAPRPSHSSIASRRRVRRTGRPELGDRRLSVGTAILEPRPHRRHGSRSGDLYPEQAVDEPAPQIIHQAEDAVADHRPGLLVALPSACTAPGVGC